MTDDNSNLVDMEDLDSFEKDFYEAPKEIEVEVDDTEDDALATEEDTDAPAETGDDEPESEEASEGEDSEETPAEESDESADDEEDKEEPKPERKGKDRKSFQSRINEITRRAHEAERREAALLQRLEALESREREVSKQEPIQEHLPPGAPDPEAVNEKGEPIYELGKYDPQYVKDLADFSVEQKMKAIEEQKAREAEAAQAAEARNKLTSEWAAKLDEVEKEEIPEIREHITELTETFRNLEPAYGEYLAMTIMQSENGPRIMEYLSQNIGEARNIVASGPAAATLAIGRLDARLARARPNEEEKRNETQKTVSRAPNPPEQVNKGRKGQTVVRPDTDDLDAFERELFYAKK